MKKLNLIILIILTIPLIGWAQDSITPLIDGPTNPEAEVNVYAAFTLKERPHFSGGYIALEKWCNKHTIYNKAMADSGIYGKICCEAIIDSLGKIKEPTILSRKTSMLLELEKETLRLMSALPNFIPGKYKEKYVNSKDIFVFTYKQDTISRQKDLKSYDYNIIILPHEK